MTHATEYDTIQALVAQHATHHATAKKYVGFYTHAEKHAAL